MTQSEIAKLHKCIAVDFKIAARKTELWELEYCHQVLHDIKKLMSFQYVSAISLILSDVNSVPVKVKKYIIGYTSRVHDDRPGCIDWETGDGSGLIVHLTYSPSYVSLSTEQKNLFTINNLKTAWSPSSIDAEFPHLTKSLVKMYTYASAGADRHDFN